MATVGVADETQIHTHMCYSEFNDIIQAIGAMDADVISTETSRSRMELLDAFVTYRYPNEIGPGVYDIHSPRVPDIEEMTGLIEKARSHLTPEQTILAQRVALRSSPVQQLFQISSSHELRNDTHTIRLDHRTNK